jgi:hypothetical protein
MLLAGIHCFPVSFFMPGQAQHDKRQVIFQRPLFISIKTLNMFFCIQASNPFVMNKNFSFKTFISLPEETWQAFLKARQVTMQGFRAGR